MIRKLIILPVIAVAVCCAILVGLVALHVVTIAGLYTYSGLRAWRHQHDTTLVSAPVKTAPQPAVPAAKETTEPAKEPVAFYTVVKGDSPLEIAKKLHVNCDELLKLNKITDPKKLQVGQKLSIPAKEKSS